MDTGYGDLLDIFSIDIKNETLIESYKKELANNN